MLRQWHRGTQGPRDERGAVAIIVSLMMVALLVVTAMVLDFGLARLDRQIGKSSADSATTSGMRAMDLGDGQVHPWSGVCAAISFLKANQPELAGLPTPSECSNAAMLQAVCVPGDSSTFAVYTPAKLDGVTVKISVPYPAIPPYTLASTGWSEEQFATLQQDQGDPAQQGCDQLGVEIVHSRRPGLGSLATNSDLASAVRSVGRVTISPNQELPVAMLILERTNCEALTVQGTNTRVRVSGNIWAPGLIQADSTGTTSCTGSTHVIDSPTLDGIVAGAAETSPLDESGNPTTLTPLPGIIGSTAMFSGNPAYAAPGPPFDAVYSLAYNDLTHYGPIPRPPTGRTPIDKDYRLGVKAAMAEANSYLVPFGSLPPTSDGTAWEQIAPQGGGCKNPTGPQLNKTFVYFNCSPAYASPTVFKNAKTVVIRGSVSKNLDLPSASRVFIDGGSGNTSAIKLTSTDRFAMHEGGGATPNAGCGSGTENERARLVIRGGSISSSATFVACHTAVLFMNDKSDGCVPATNGALPTDSPCPGQGNGYINFTGGPIDWTAPNRMETAAMPALPADRYDLEDLALWTETADTGNSLSSGGSAMHLKGVFFAPNAAPFSLAGSATQQADDAQYVVRTLKVTGGATIMMKPNPYNAPRIPVLGGFQLVR